MFGSTLPPVCRRAHILFMLFVFVCVYWCPTHIVLCFCFVFRHLVYPITCVVSFSVLSKARYTRYKFCIQVSIQENLDQENLNSSLCIHDARNFYEYTQVLAGDTTNKMTFLGGEEGASLCIALLCTIILRRRLSSKKRSIWARKWLRRRRWDVFL